VRPLHRKRLQMQNRETAGDNPTTSEFTTPRVA
jgi:hypothetical protein